MVSSLTKIDLELAPSDLFHIKLVSRVSFHRPLSNKICVLKPMVSFFKTFHHVNTVRRKRFELGQVWTSGRQYTLNNSWIKRNLKTFDGQVQTSLHKNVIFTHYTLKTFDGQVRTSPHKSKNRIAVKYVMGCAIGMQLHSHGLVKAYITDCARVIQLHSHGLVKNLRHWNKVSQPENRYVTTNHKNDIKLLEITPCWGVLFQLSVDSLRSRVSSLRKSRVSSLRPLSNKI